MKFNKNNIFVFFNSMETANQVSEMLKKKFPAEKGNLIEAAYELSDAEKLLKKHYKNEVFFDIFALDLKIPSAIRNKFIVLLSEQYPHANHEFVLAGNDSDLKAEDKKLLESKKRVLIPDTYEITLFSLLENIIEKRFNEKKYNLINRIDDIIHLRLDSREILSRIADITLEYLGLKICWISLVNYDTKKLGIGALTGFGKYEEEYRNAFDISLSDESVTIECLNRKKQIQYEDVSDDMCPFKYKELAKKIALKSILLTPIFDKKKRPPVKKVLGTLNLYTDFPHKFQEDELELAQIIAAKTSDALSMKGLYDEEKAESQRKLSLIEKVAAEINKNVSDYKGVFKTIVKESLKLVNADRGCIKLCYEDFISCEHRECNNANCDRENYRFPDITNYVIQQKKSLLIGDLESFPFKDPEIEYYGVNSIISVPLRLNDKVIGVLTAEHNEEKYFDNNHLQLFEALAKHAVIAIENTKRYKQLQKRWQAQLVIKKLIEETSKLEAIEDERKRNKYRTEQLDHVIEDALKETGKIFDATSGIVVLATFTDNFAYKNPKWQFGLEGCTIPELEIGVIEKGRVTFKGKKCITGKVIAEGKLYNCKNVTKDDYYLEYGENDKTKSEIVVPLKFQRQTFGAFTLDSNEENGFSREDEEILMSIATQMALLIRRFRFLNTLLDLNKPFKKIDNLGQLYNEIARRTSEVLGTNVSYLRILDRNQLIIKGSKGLGNYIYKLPLEVGEGIAGKVVKKLKPAIIPNVQNPSYGFHYLPFAKKNNLFGMISFPIISIDSGGNKNLIGIVNTYANRICYFTPLDLQLMLAIAEKAGEAIKKAKLIKQLDDIARVDRMLTTTSEKVVLQDIANVAKNLLDADQVVLYQYYANIAENFGFSSPATVSGDFKYDKFKSQTNFTDDSLVVLLLGNKSNEFFIESYDEDLIKKIYKNGIKKSIKPFYQREQLKSVIILKLTYRKEVVGILFINYRYSKSFSSEEKRIAKTFANKAAIAISNTRKYEDIERLHSVGNAITSESDIKKVLEKIASNAQATLKADIIIVHRYDSAAKKAIHPPIQSGHINYPNAIEGKYGETNVISNLIEKNKDVFAIDVKIDELFRSGDDWKSGSKKVPRFTEREKIKSCAAMLLKVKNEIVGVMFINYRTKQKFEPQQKRTIKVFANQAAIAIRNANLIKESRETIERISVNLTAIQKSGYKIVKKLNKSQVTEPDILQPILSKALELIDVNMGYIGVNNKKKKNTKIVVCSEKYKKLQKKSLTRYYPDAKWIKKKKKFDIFSGDKKSSDYRRFADNPQFLSGTPDVVFKEDKDVKSALRVPIYSSKDFLGMIVLESETPNAFSKIDAYAVMSLANQASMALQNYRLIQQLRELRRVDFAILKEQYNLDKVLEIILKAALDLVKKKYADIKLIMDNGDLIIKKSIPRGAEGNIFGVSRCLSGIAVEKKKTFYEKGVSQNPRFLKTPGVEAKSELVIPLMVDKKPIGVLNIESEELDDFTKEDINILEMLAGQASIAIYNAQLSENNKRRREELKALRDIDQAILDSKMDLPDTLNVILAKGLELIGEKRGSIILTDKDNDKLVVKKSTNQKNEGIKIGKNEGVYGRAFNRGKTIYNKYLDNDPLFEQIPQKSFKSELIIPLIVGDTSIGLLNVKSEEEKGFNEDQIELLENLSGAAAIAIDNAQQYDEVEKAKKELENSISKEVFAGYNRMHSVFEHKISNSVGMIRLKAKDLLESKIASDNKAKNDLEIILRNAEKALNAPNEATIKANELIFSRRKKIDVPGILDTLKKNIQNEMNQDVKIDIMVNFPTQLPPVEADYNLLYEGVFAELIRNAIKAMPDGGEIKFEGKLIKRGKKQSDGKRPAPYT